MAKTGTYGIEINPHNGNITASNVFVISRYSSLNFVDDGEAAENGVPLGGIYHTAGTLKIRLT